MGIYNIAGIKIKLNYHYSDYFEHNIDSYLTSDQDFNHEIKVSLSEHIPYDRNAEINQSPMIFNEKSQRTFYAFTNDQKVKAKIIHDLSYTSTSIEIVPNLMKNPAEIEYTLMGMIFLEIAQRYHFIPFHASAVSYRKQVMLFAAPSKTGKSTHAHLWKTFNQEVFILNDDKPLIRLDDQVFNVYSSPFSGKTSKNINTIQPLKAIFFIKQATFSQVEKMSHAEKLKEIMRNTLRPSDDEGWSERAGTLTKLIHHIPIFTLQATKDFQAVKVVYDTLYGENVYEN